MWSSRAQVHYRQGPLKPNPNPDSKTDRNVNYHNTTSNLIKGSPYSIIERRVLKLIPVLGSQPAGDVSHKPDGRLPLLSARPAVTTATLKRPVTNFAAW